MRFVHLLIVLSICCSYDLNSFKEMVGWSTEWLLSGLPLFGEENKRALMLDRPYFFSQSLVESNSSRMGEDALLSTTSIACEADIVWRVSRKTHPNDKKHKIDYERIRKECVFQYRLIL